MITGREKHGAAIGVRVLLVLALLPGCVQPAQDYFPLHPGWEWQYAMRIATADGPRQGKHLVINLPAYELAGVSTVPRRSPDGTTMLYARGAQGVLRVGEAAEGGEPRRYPVPQTVLPAGIAAGTTWKGDTRTRVLEVTSHAAGALYRIEADVPLLYTVESVDDAVRVPAGEFSGCLRVHASGSTLAEVRKQVGLAEIKVDQMDWYAPGVGLVKSERRETTSSSALPGGTLEVELERLRKP